MGLDMYLEKDTYIGNEFKAADKMVKVIIPEDQEGEFFKITGIKNERISTITEHVGYWRKANAIHNWFVENVQGGVDECQRSWVAPEHLEELLSIVQKILKDNSLAGELLPTTQGFFFGSVEYDEWYFEDLRTTEQILKDALKEEGGEIYYQASW